MSVATTTITTTTTTRTTPSGVTTTTYREVIKKYSLSVLPLLEKENENAKVL